MPATLLSMAAKSREDYWNKFLASLAPWELHHLLSKRDPMGDSIELSLHDEFIAGHLRLMDVRAMLAVEVRGA